MDCHALELPDGRFDVTGSQFGVMLVPDQPRALREMVRVTKPGGRVLVIAYGPPAKLEFLQVFISALKAVAPQFPGLPDDPPPLEFQVSDPDVPSPARAPGGPAGAAHHPQGRRGRWGGCPPPAGRPGSSPPPEPLPGRLWGGPGPAGRCLRRPGGLPTATALVAHRATVRALGLTAQRSWPPDRTPTSWRPNRAGSSPSWPRPAAGQLVPSGPVPLPGRLARLAGAAPVPVSPGQRVRHRRNRGGDRQPTGPAPHRDAAPGPPRTDPGLHQPPHRPGQEPAPDPPLPQTHPGPPAHPAPAAHRHHRSLGVGLTAPPGKRRPNKGGDGQGSGP
jgi:hypothetical protein